MKIISTLKEVEATTFRNGQMTPYNIFVNKELPEVIPEDLFAGELLEFLKDIKGSGDLSKLPFARDIVEDKKKGTYRLKGMRNINPYKSFVKMHSTLSAYNDY